MQKDFVDIAQIISVFYLFPQFLIVMPFMVALRCKMKLAQNFLKPTRRIDKMLRQLLSKANGILTRPNGPYRIEDRSFWDAKGPERRKVFIQEANERIGVKPLGFSWDTFNEFFETGNRRHYEDEYFERRRMLNLRILAECFENQDRFIPDIIENIQLILDEPIWALHAHLPAPPPEGTPSPESGEQVVDLFAAETGAQLSLGAYMLRSKLPAEFYEKIQTALNNRIFRPYLTHFYRWMGNEGEKLMNWTTWCSQNLLIAIAFADPRFPIEEVAQKAIRSLDLFYTGYGEDGCCDEGPQYYRHAGLSLSTAVHLLTKLNPIFSEIFSENKYRNIAHFILNMHIDGEYYFNFADASTKAGHCNAREFLFGKQINSPALMNFAAEDVKKNPLTFNNIDDVIGINLFYCLIEIEYEDQVLEFQCSPEDAMKPSDVDYPSAGIFLRRRGDYQLAVKAGSNNDAHNHNDVGSFTLYKKGQPMLIDVGVETYQRKTFSPERYTIWTMQSAWHNLPTFGENMQLDGQEYGASELNVQENSISMDIAKAYPVIDGLSYYRRKVSISEESVSVEDQSDYEGEIMLSLMSQEKPEVVDRESILSIELGSLGTIHTTADRIETDRIPIEDPRLRKAWPDTLYRSRLYFKKNIELTIQ